MSSSGIRFTQFAPAEPLKEFVQAYWTGEFNIGQTGPVVQKVLPNGCIELIVHLTSAHCTLPAGTDWATSPALTLIGLHQNSYAVRFPHYVRVFGIRMFPDGLRNIFGISPAAIASAYHDGLDVVNVLNGHVNQLREAVSDQERIKLADGLLLQHLAVHVDRFDYTHYAMKMIRKAHAYNEVVASVAISQRQLQREFVQRYGMTIRDYIRIERLNAIQRYMLAGEHKLLDMVYSLDFTDQAHFSREVRHFAGVAPGQLMRNLAGFIANPG